MYVDNGFQPKYDSMCSLLNKQKGVATVYSLTTAFLNIMRKKRKWSSAAELNLLHSSPASLTLWRQANPFPKYDIRTLFNVSFTIGIVGTIVFTVVTDHTTGIFHDCLKNSNTLLKISQTFRNIKIKIFNNINKSEKYFWRVRISGHFAVRRLDGTKIAIVIKDIRFLVKFMGLNTLG